MKRQRLIDRVKLIADAEEALDGAVSDLRNAENQGSYYLNEARKKLRIAAVKYGLVAIRYLGGRRED